MTDDSAVRIKELEVEVRHLADTVERLSQHVETLVELKNMGFGAFWLASAIFGSGIVGGVLGFWHWMKG